jgi:crotonobetainyl-CoA:carnitine CoA-transferase CaiB-like acyl-CoA transferase
MVEETVMEMSFSAQEEAFRREVRDFRPADRVRLRGLADYLAILAALHWRATTGAGRYIDVAMAATLMVVNERARVHLNDADLGAEPTILDTTDCPFFEGPRGEHFTVATRLVGSLTFPSYLRGMWRADLADDPRFATAAARRAHFTELRCFLQTWILTFHDSGALDAQLDEAKIALGEVRSLKKLSEMEWAEYWGRGPRSLGPQRWNLPPARPSFCVSPAKSSSPPGDPAFQGERNHTVFGELGLSECEIDGFIASGALWV